MNIIRNLICIDQETTYDSYIVQGINRTQYLVILYRLGVFLFHYMHNLPFFHQFHHRSHTKCNYFPLLHVIFRSIVAIWTQQSALFLSEKQVLIHLLTALTKWTRFMVVEHCSLSFSSQNEIQIKCDNNEPHNKYRMSKKKRNQPGVSPCNHFVRFLLLIGSSQWVTDTDLALNFKLMCTPLTGHDDSHFDFNDLILFHK